MALYRSPYEAYPFLCDADDDLRCDFELLTDELASGTGLLRSQVAERNLQEELVWICELIYHINPTLRTSLTVTEEETKRLAAMVDRMQAESTVHGFVLPCGCESACTAHLLRVRAKCLVRLLYRCLHRGHEVPERLLDLCNLLSGYFFLLALKLNALEGVEERGYRSRNYR
ncbi:MAG: ATP--cob(I)alamin adenosyltransferase [Bacteroidales bacterium]|nr:ATP--cob(I)alamin adenosyltransferase [Bacteroidales bacterium]MCM1415296.1 ATP--cob(I)alamin adenosyltransferase [bacterium]MCM1423452.1 ATP--cob(I)alamin adenosyltransferase [bacterium]